MCQKQLVDLVILNASQVQPSERSRADIEEQIFAVSVDDQSSRGMISDWYGCAAAEEEDFHTRCACLCPNCPEIGPSTVKKGGCKVLKRVVRYEARNSKRFRKSSKL